MPTPAYNARRHDAPLRGRKAPLLASCCTSLVKLYGGARRGNTGIENWAFGMKLAEYHSGYMLYSRKAMEAIPREKLSHSFDFDLETIMPAGVQAFA